MRCNRCGFENMPRLKTCIQCSSVLAVTAPVPTTPPRAGWTKGLRPIRYWLNRRLGFHVFDSLREPVAEAARTTTTGLAGLAWAFLSVVPGLAHLFQRRLKEIRWPLLAWFVALLAGLLFYGTDLGGTLLGVASAVHAWILVDASRLRRHVRALGVNLVAVMIAFVVLFWGVYGGVRRFAGRYVNGVFAPQRIAAMGIERGDYILASRRAYQSIPPQRGDLVLYETQGAHFRGQNANYVFDGGLAMARVLGLPGESVRVEAGTITIARGGETRASFATTGVLAKVKDTFVVPEGHCFCLPQGLFSQRRIPVHLIQRILPLVGLPAIRAIEGRVFMVYNPINRRHFLSRAFPKPGSQGRP